MILRDYQNDAVSCVLNDLGEYKKLALILPTGSGKTTIFIDVIDRYLKSHPSSSILVLSHSDILTTQTIDRLKVQTPHLNIGRLQAGVYPSHDCNVVVGTMQTSSKKHHTDVAKLSLDKPVSLIIVDECHFLYCDSYDSALAAFPTAKLLGCTATPLKQKQSMLNYFDKVSYSISLKELINQGYLVPPELHQIVRDSKETEEVIAQTASVYIEREYKKSAVIFLRTKAECELMRNTLEDKGIIAHAITDDVVGDRREFLLSEFSKQKIHVFVTCNVLTAGVDLPCLEVVMLPWGCQSPTTYLQRIGRGLRLFPDKTCCRVYCSGDNPTISKGFYEHLEKQALTLGSKVVVPMDTLEEEMKYNNYDGHEEQYLWTKRLLEVIKRMNKVGMTHFASLLNHKKFPDKFLNDITRFSARLPNSKTAPDGELATTAQFDFLVKAGFNPEHMDNLSKIEASRMVTVILGPQGDKWTVWSGVHKGKKVWEIPIVYRSIVMKKVPQSNLAKQFRDYKKFTNQGKQK